MAATTAGVGRLGVYRHGDYRQGERRCQEQKWAVPMTSDEINKLQAKRVYYSLSLKVKLCIML